MPLIQCRHLNPCFPHRVVQLMSQRDRRLYLFFHVCLWTGVLAFAIGTGLYAATRTYTFFIMALPCVCVIFVGQFGFRWLALKNEDKFAEFYPTDRQADSFEMNLDTHDGQMRRRLPSLTLGAPPPPEYSETYDGPIFTIDGNLAPPPRYEECTAGAVPREQQQQQQQQQPKDPDEAEADPQARQQQVNLNADLRD